MPSIPHTSRRRPGLPIHVYLVALITWKSLQRLKSDLLEMIAMSYVIQFAKTQHNGAFWKFIFLYRVSSIY